MYVGVAVAEVGADLVVDLLEGLADLVDLLRREPVERVLRVEVARCVAVRQLLDDRRSGVVVARAGPGRRAARCRLGSPAARAGCRSSGRPAPPRPPGPAASLLLCRCSWPLQIDLYLSLGGIDAGPDRLALLAVDLARPQVAYLPASQLADAGVADPHPAAVGEVAAGLLAADEDRNARLAGRLEVGDPEADGAAASDLGVAGADDRLEALRASLSAMPSASQCSSKASIMSARAREERLAIAPVGAELVEVLGDERGPSGRSGARGRCSRRTRPPCGAGRRRRSRGRARAPSGRGRCPRARRGARARAACSRSA